jgi:Protein of unknown function (DUF2855)
MPQIVYVSRTDLSAAEIREQDLGPLAEGGVRVGVESFSVTANNVTYALAGEMMKYWDFFPAPAGQGVVPMWGHARVVESRHPDVAVGERVYGYLPMASHLDVAPVKISPGQFVDSAPHRQPMAAIYNTYSRLAADPEHDPAREGKRMVYGGLFKTGFLIEDMFRRAGWHGAEALIITSASSKTALGLASVAKAYSPGVRRVGLTSAGNVAFVEGTGLYDLVIAYDRLEELPGAASVVVDMAGDAALLGRIHRTLAGHLRHSCLVGMTHVGAAGAPAEPSPGPTPTFFFAPDAATACIGALGPDGFARAVAERWRGFLTEMDGRLRLDERHGLDAARDAFIAAYRGEADPAVGVIVRP